MRQIKLERGVKESSKKKVAMEPGGIAPVGTDNFETLTNPPFKAKLDLIEADPHNPPTMNAQTDQNITTEGDDPNKPSAKDIVKKAPEYENSNAIEEHKVPHENERVKQSGIDHEALIAQMKAEFSQKFALASRLFDIKVAAGVDQEINRQNFVHSTADNSNVTPDQLQNQINDSEAYLKQIQAGQTRTAATVPSPSLRSVMGQPVQRKEASLDDDLEIAIMGGF